MTTISPSEEQRVLDRVPKQLYIAGEWRDGAKGTLAVEDPATEESLCEVADASEEDARAALDAAAEAGPEWSQHPPRERGEILRRAFEAITERSDELALLMTLEMGKPIAESKAEIAYGAEFFRWFAEEAVRIDGRYAVTPNGQGRLLTMKQPVGPTLMITPWNFPLAIPTWKIMPALVAGNTVVFKPATLTPLLAVRLVEVFEEAGLPPGVLNLVLGTGGEVGDAILAHPDIALVSFTGSTATGDHVAMEAARTRKRVSLELGGKNAIIVLDDADLDLALDGIVWSAFGTSGQRCTAASRVIVHRSVERALTDRLAERVGKLRLGDGLQEGVEIGPVISRSQLERINSYMAIGRQEGAELVIGGAIVSDGNFARGHFHQPTIFGGAKASMRIAQEEIFGPVTTIIPVDSFEEAIDAANGVQYGLSAAIYTADVNRAFRAMQDIDTGILYVNAGTIGAEIQLPFGGTKATGNGHREAGQAALDVVTEWQSIYVDYSGQLQRAQIDTDKE